MGFNVHIFLENVVVPDNYIFFDAIRLVGAKRIFPLFATEGRTPRWAMAGASRDEDKVFPKPLQSMGGSTPCHCCELVALNQKCELNVFEYFRCMHWL